jgi:nitrite reductase (cytochrome c-552)
MMTNNRRALQITAVTLVLVTLGTTALLVNIFERKAEAKKPFFKVVEITDEMEDPAIWGKNFPMQYDDYKKTVDIERTKYGGSEALPHGPTEKDPRKIVSQSKIDLDPRLKEMWLGYAFSKDFREERGHAYMLEDQMFTGRQDAVKQPGACINCHASVYVNFKKAGNGDIMKGFEHYNKIAYRDIQSEFKHPVSCIDCHNPDDMSLRISRPAFIEGIANLKKSQGIANYDVNKMATRQEMRSFVCGQCHVEYYFKGEDKRLTFPWHNGLKIENIVAYYEEVKHKDFVHKKTDAPVLKAQHPEFELWSQGTHAKAGVSCVDCHMPYKKVGAYKISDHHVRSPLLNINKSCQTCHNVPEAELKARAEDIQTRFTSLKNTALDSLMEFIQDLEKAKNAKVPEEKLAKARDYQRKAQFYIDFVEAENSTGFHAPGESLRILGESINYVRLGQKELK